MSLSTQALKLQAHAERLLDDFILLRSRYAMLAPMLFNQAVTKARAAGRQSRGFLILRSTLLLSCAQDVAKIAFDQDKDKNKSSIASLMEALQSEPLRSRFRTQYELAAGVVLVNDDEDPEVRRALAQWTETEREGRRQHFNNTWQEMCDRWSSLENSGRMRAFRTIRNKITAHSVIRPVEDTYEPFKIDGLGLKWSDLSAAIEDMQPMIDGLNGLIRSAGYAWESLEKQLGQASRDFWLED